MNQPIHVLHVLGKLNAGGAESRVMDLLRNLDRTKIQFDFMIHTQEHCAYEDEAVSLGAKIYRVPRFKFYNILSYKKAWKDFLKEHPEIKIIHGHMTSTAGIYLPIAKGYGKYTIAHVRSAGVDKGLKGKLTTFLRRNLADKCDQPIACSKLAARNAYGEKDFSKGKIMIFQNAIEADKFEYNLEKRKEIRQKYNIQENEFVIGHVGRFDDMKNHKYMIEILNEALKIDTNVRMMFVGEGSLKASVEAQAKELGILEKVIFTGRQSKVQDYYCAMDFFILPSFYEGLPGTSVESQASGLPGILSDRVTDETLITDLQKQMSIDLPAAAWAEEILKYRNYERHSRIEEVKKAGFDVKAQVRWLEDFYLEKVE